MLDTMIGLASLILSGIVLIYTIETRNLTKNERNARNIDESLQKFYYPLHENLARHYTTRDFYVQIIQHRSLVEEDMQKKLDEFMIYLESGPQVYVEEKDSSGKIYLTQMSKWKTCDLVKEEISNIIKEKERELTRLRK